MDIRHIALLMTMPFMLVANAGLTKSALAAHNAFTVSNLTLPYDSQVEYIDISIPAYIDTHLPVKALYQIAIDAQWLSTGGSSLGTLVGSSGDRFGTLRYRTKSYSELNCANSPGSLGSGSWLRFTVSPLERHKYAFGASGAFLDDVLLFDKAILSNLSFTLKICGYNVNNTQRQGNCRIWRFTISNGTDTVIDLVPVRIGEVGYMYDLMSGNVYGNENTTGTISPGPDVL